MPHLISPSKGVLGAVTVAMLSFSCPAGTCSLCRRFHCDLLEILPRGPLGTLDGAADLRIFVVIVALGVRTVV